MALVLTCAFSIGAVQVGNESPVADAAMKRDLPAVRSLLQQGADVNAAQGDGMTALHWAAENGDAEMTKVLLAAGGRPQSITRNGSYTPLHLAGRRGSAAVIKALLSAGASVGATTTSGGATALHFAAANGNRDAVAALLDGKAEVDALEAFGQTPLMWAAAADRTATVELLLARGAKIGLASKVENVPARERQDRAAQQARNRRIAALRAAENPQANRPAAQPAAQPNRQGNINAASAATPPAQAQAGAPPRDSIGLRALSYGELVGNKGGLSALHFAARQGHTQTVLALLKAGADINQLSGDNTSPLLMATMNGHFDLAALLLQRGGNPKHASDAGATPLYAALNVQWSAKSLYPQPTAYKQQKLTYLDLMEALLKAGADPNARLTKHLWYMSYNFDLLGVNTTGATPFWRAAYGTDVPAMKLLKQYGADHTIPTIKVGGGRQRGDDAPAEDEGDNRTDPSGLPAIPAGGPGVYPLHAASGVGYGEGYAANAHRHAPGGWLPSVKYLIEELGVDVNLRDHNGYNAVHHAAARGDNELIEYLVSRKADVTAISRRGQTTADMANGPVQRVPPFLDTVALLEKLGSKNSHKCRSC